LIIQWFIRQAIRPPAIFLSLLKIELFKQNPKMMKNLTIFLVTVSCLIVIELHSQTLVNDLDMSNLYVQLDDKNTLEVRPVSEFVLPYNATSMVLYQDDQYSYWVDFKFKQCGKKAKLKGHTYLELSNGEVISGQAISQKKKIDKGENDWLTGVVDDEFKIDKTDDHALNAGFTYTLRFSN
jgi:hypothetical protein